MIFMLSIYILIYISRDVDFKKLTPVLGNDIKPILQTLPSVVMFPFGEIFIFLMYWHYFNDKSSVRKTTSKAVLYLGILLCQLFLYLLGIKYNNDAFRKETSEKKKEQ
ncbi:GerAB/ArcD/ProY family transporter [Clostridium autoethanogenum]|uniref:GerAB/ArcD/ProY family transporter n=1 Tax=Clostridium autoethanogenum TaxID=84023 RepID=UPI002556B4F4|nr:GerAB/ArcD/ProY family transporter [Clostridium autoethanogenum]